MSQNILVLEGSATANNGAKWVTKPPDMIQTKWNHPGEYTTNANLPAGGVVRFSYKRTNVNPPAVVQITITNNGGAIQVATHPTHAANLSAVAVQQKGQVTITFQGQ
jgi:hypothetical protein